MIPDEEDGTTADEVETDKANEDIEEDDIEEDEEEEEDLQAVCGVAILMDFDGKGITFIPIPVEGKKVERTATADDIVSLIAGAYAHINANLAVGKLLANLTTMSKTKKGRIIHPGARV